MLCTLLDPHEQAIGVHLWVGFEVNLESASISLFCRARGDEFDSGCSGVFWSVFVLLGMSRRDSSSNTRTYLLISMTVAAPTARATSCRGRTRSRRASMLTGINRLLINVLRYERREPDGIYKTKNTTSREDSADFTAYRNNGQADRLITCMITR